MELQIITGVVSTMFGGAGTFFLKRWMEMRKHQKIKGVLGSINGDWKGKIKQRVNGKNRTVPVTMNFETSGKKVKGKCYLTVEDDKKMDLKFTGFFAKERYIKFEYENADPATFQFGTYLAQLSPSGKELEGKFVGYGIVNREIITGSAALQRQQPA